MSGGVRVREQQKGMRQNKIMKLPQLRAGYTLCYKNYIKQYNIIHDVVPIYSA